jgi:hypothetical protein
VLSLHAWGEVLVASAALAVVLHVLLDRRRPG